MKTLQKKLSILFLLFMSLCYSQTYTFDKLVKFNFSAENHSTHERINFFNSEDDSYYMWISSRKDTLQSTIFDKKENILHYFYIDKLDSLKLYYKKSVKYIKRTHENKFEFSKIKEKKGKKTIIFKIRKKKVKRIARYKLTIEETDEDYFYIFKSSMLELESHNKTKPLINFIVLEAKGRYEDGSNTRYELTSHEDINLNITIPSLNLVPFKPIKVQKPKY